METWQKIVAHSIQDAQTLARHLDIDIQAVDRVCRRYPLRINPYYLGLIKRHGTPLYLQAVPDLRELDDDEGLADPLDEHRLSPVPGLVHKYPDRALLLVSHECAMYCRFCTRKQTIGQAKMAASGQNFQASLAYLRQNPTIRDILLSGGDPLLLPDEELDRILTALRAIDSIDIIRIGTRVPCTLPMRITAKLTAMLKRHHPLYINTHFNHPAELTVQAAKACTRLADAGIPLGCQTVLLKGVNDRPEIIEELMRGLLRIRVRPYYLFQLDLTRGATHFRTRIQTGQEIMRHLIENVSGLAIPHFALDAPDGSGKIPLTPCYIQHAGDILEFTTRKGGTCSYPND